MSSHHFVKEGQEPALMIANGEACSSELLGQLLEWSPFVLVLDGAIYRVMDLNIKVDAVLGDFDRAIDIEHILKDQQPVEIIHTPDQNKTDLQKGIEFLIARGYTAVNIVWATGKRADHTLSNITDFIRYADKIKIVLFDDYSKIFCLPKVYEKWYTQGTPLSLMPVGTVTGVSSSGLKYELRNDTLTIGQRTSSSNEAAADGVVKITYEGGSLLMMECRD